MNINWEYIVSLLSGGLGVFLLKLYGDWRKNKRGDAKDVVGGWQEIAGRESDRYDRLEVRATLLEAKINDRDYYIKQLEKIIVQAGLKLPEKVD